MISSRDPLRPTRPVDTLLVTGFLGAGKTTLLSGWLAERPAGERWAVLVNEFGALGVDRALLGGAGGEPEVAVAEVAGGCACCAARVAFSTTLTRLLRRGPWDRLFVETTGLGHPAQLLDQLRAPALARSVRVLPPVAVVDAGRAALYLESTRPGHEIATDQAALARLLVLNRVDAVGSEAARTLAHALGELPPWSRPVLPTATGRVPLAEVLAAVGEPVAERGRAFRGDRVIAAPESAHEAEPAPAPSGRHPGRVDAAVEPLRWQRAESAAAAAGWRWPASVAFDRSRLRAALDGLAAADGPLRACGLLRGKGVFRTERAWYAWQWVDGRARWDETAWRADSRLEVLTERPIDLQAVDDALRPVVAAG